MKTEQKWKIGDCLGLLPEIPDKSIDMILTDLPYGTTACSWDNVIPFEPLWIQYKRIIKDNGAIVLTASQPFTSMLIMSNLKMFKYSWVWDKVNSIRNHLNAKRQPMRCTEDITVFYSNQSIYNPIMREGSYISRKTKAGQSNGFGKVTSIDKGRTVSSLYPTNLVRIKGHDPNNIIHPTQKPLALFEYLIKTYTNEGDTVHDSCLGSGTTLEACMNLNRNCIGFEIDPQWEQIYRKRLKLDNANLDAFNTSACPK